ncbi:MAG: alpha/beta hydrolase-fold protein [Balneola sp.]
MRSILLFIFCIVFIQSHSLYAQNDKVITDKKPFVIGETIEFYSDILSENRTLNIYLPNGYNPEELQKYPVIYLLDGSAGEDFIHIAGLVQFGSFPWIELIPETIVVGIGNVDRRRDFTYPTTIEIDKKDFPTAGASENFIQFIESELQPLIQKQYKTNGQRSIIGQSLGGLLATEILFKKPNLFDNYIIASPSLWWDDQSLLSWEPAMYESEKSIYVAVGKEGEIMERDANSLYKKLKAEPRKNTTLHFEFFEEQDHGDVLHLAVYDAFEKIFRKEE